MLAVVTGPAQSASLPTADNASQAQDIARTHAAYGELPISFEANRGQTDAQVRFLSRGAGYSLFLTPAEAVLSLRSDSIAAETRDGRGNLGAQGSGRQAVVRLSFAGANATPAMQGQDPQDASTHYFLGDRSATDVGNFAKVRYEDLYPGIDLLYYGNQRQLEYDFIVAPGVDPAQIALDVAGVDTLRIDAGGNLVMGTALGDIVQRKPVVYQQIQGRRIEIDSAYAMQSRAPGRLPPRRLRSQPSRWSSTRCWSTAPTWAARSATRPTTLPWIPPKNAYITGTANSAAFPTKGAFQSTNKGAGDIFVAKFGPTGTLLYSTYIGGIGQDEGAAIAVDASGAAYVTGRTTSVDFPTAAPFQSSLGGTQDAFLVKLNAAGNGLVYSTYLGGSANTIDATKTGEYGTPLRWTAVARPT